LRVPGTEESLKITDFSAAAETHLMNRFRFAEKMTVKTRVATKPNPINAVAMIPHSNFKSHKLVNKSGTDVPQPRICDIFFYKICK